ncbi:MAG TPA: ABC transporter permease [Candidatus Choladousia intestinigallinarum]|nr:ABC transporter permease [Candidatus Choladousia intestinigallinarum]
MLENIRLSFQGIWSHKLRSLLTMLGIIIGIASIISIVSTIKGTNEEIKNQLVGSGTNTVDVQLYSEGYVYSINSSSDIPHGIQEVSEETRQRILDIDTVENVTCYKERINSDGVFYQNKALTSVAIRGIDTSYFATTGYIIRTGRNFIEDDYANFRKVVILDETAASDLFRNESPIGQTIEINKVPFTIIGVVDEASKFEPTINSISDYYTYASSDSSGSIFMPTASWPIVYTYDEPENVIVKATSTDDMEDAGKQAEDILNATITDSESNVKYRADNLLEQARSLQQLSAATNNQLIWIASISLLVGGIGVMNIMLVSVTERTSEIGLKKAVGAKKSSILAQFLTEAAVLTSLGGIVGVGAGIGMAQVINRISGVAVSISVPASAIAVVFSMLIGIIFGFLPSVQAANLDPIEALRRE